MRRIRRPRLEQPIALGEILERSGEHRHSPYPPPFELRLWAKLVGPGIARRSEPKSLHNGVLLVQVESSAWAQELFFLQSTILEALTKAGLKVQTLRFRTEPLGIQAPPVAKPKPVPKPVPAELRSVLGSVEDPELREVLSELSQYLAS